jgi:hypothetical protein
LINKIKSLAIYQTGDVAASIRKMMERNDYCIYYYSMNCDQLIPHRLNCISDIPQLACRPWDTFAHNNIDRWRESRELMWYTEAFVDLLPQCEALLFAECPLQYEKFERIAERVEREIVIYRPPSWKLHENTIATKYQGSANHQAVLMAIECLRSRELTPRYRDALNYAGFPEGETSVFSSTDILILLRIPHRQLQSILKYRFRGFYVRYHVFRPTIEPDDEWGKEMFNILMAEPEVGQGLRMLRFGELSAGRIDGFKRWLLTAHRFHHVERMPDIYLLKSGYRKPSYVTIDALANAHRGDWYKMRNIVDGAPSYDDSD